MDERPWFVYLLMCQSNRIYTGATPDLKKRFDKHQSGRGATFTRIDRPKQLLAAKRYESKSKALRAEYQIKRLSRAQKLHMAQQWSEQHPVDRIPEDCSEEQ